MSTGYSIQNSETKERSTSSRTEMLLDCLLMVTASVHVLLCPFTKVEESFNLQAVHDILHHGSNLDDYDHHMFPGVVPRTFLGPLLVSGLGYPLVRTADMMGWSKTSHQVMVRMVLATSVLAAFSLFRSAVRNRFGAQVSVWLALLTMSQFHLMFYMSRPLPNIMALVPTLVSLALWLKGHSHWFIFTSAAAILIFRGELAMLLGTILLMELVVGKVKLKNVILVGLLSLVVWIPLTVSVDSFFWRRLVWPEAEVMYFNVVLNKSSDWGTQPLLWYFYSVLPRALGTSVVFLALAPVLDRRTLLLLCPCVVFISLFSLLPHKELRFILYTFPLLNTAISVCLARLWNNRHKSMLRMLLGLAVMGHLLANTIMTSGLLYISSLNYPGGQAIETLHQLESEASDVRVHLDVFTCQTGVSRFTQQHQHWSYDKTEDLTDEQLQQFSHLIMEGHHKASLDLKPFLETHQIVAEITSYSGIKLNYSTFPPLTVQTKPSIFILKKKT